MKKTGLLVLIISLLFLRLTAFAGGSFYPLRPDDNRAVYFTPENFNITTDGKADISDPLQAAINKLKLEHNLGIIFIPSGTYYISKTIYIPAAIRIIGYGENRPLIILRKNSPGFGVADETDKGRARYMFWFTSSVVDSTGKVNDAGAGTFYSALSNIDLSIEDGNPFAVALRTHYAQHSFISHCDIHIGKGKAGMFDIGNEMEDVRFFDGEYGIYTTKASPGWQFMMIDTWFEGQRKAAIHTREAGLTIMRMHVRNVPRVVEVEPNYWEKLYMEDCSFENVGGPAISFDDENNAHMQVNLRNVVGKNVPVLVEFMKSGKQIKSPGKMFRVDKLIYGLQLDLIHKGEIKTTVEAQAIADFKVNAGTDIPDFPGMDNWVNLKALGAKGDGESDDTRVIEEAIGKYSVIYVPQGLYRITHTLRLKSNTVLVGLHPMATQFILGESTESFSGFGSPVPMIETAQRGTNIISGIGFSTGEYNFRAVACKWTAGEHSMINDVKFVGGHGTMKDGPWTPWRGYSNAGKKPAPSAGMEPAWDSQYWSLWITGGGIFKNIWTASTFATSGVYVSNTEVPSRIYAMSVEHHVRNEVRFSHVANWKVYALQLEEESRESTDCQPMEICGCHDMLFANLYMFRVIRVKEPYPYSVRTWNCDRIEMLNVHNYSQVKYTTDNPVYDVNSDTEIRPQEFARLELSASRNVGIDSLSLLGRGFEFAEGLCSDSKGNVYFSEQRMKRIYKWSAENGNLELLADYPWEPLSLACDSKDNLLVVFKYNPQWGHMVMGEQEKFVNPPDAGGTSFSGWGNSGFATLVYAIDPDHPDETLQPLQKVSISSVKKVYKALYPANRWRDSHDFNEVTVAPASECFLAPDSMTIIPVCYDLARSSALAEAWPSETAYVCDEYDKRTVAVDTDPDGSVSNLRYFAEKGEFSAVKDNAGNVYIADGDVYVFDPSGHGIRVIHIPERPSTLVFGGKDHKDLFVTGRKGFYRILNQNTCNNE